MRTIGRAVWGIGASTLYASMEPIRRAEAGATIADVPCGGGVALRALSPEQDVRYIAADLSPKMLNRAGRRAAGKSLRQVELIEADVIGTSFFLDGTRRCRALFKAGSRRGHPLPPQREDLWEWLRAAGLERVTIGPQRGFTNFSATRG